MRYSHVELGKSHVQARLTGWFCFVFFSLQGVGGREVGLRALWGSPFSQKQENDKSLNSMFPLIVLNTKISKKKDEKGKSL